MKLSRAAAELVRRCPMPHRLYHDTRNGKASCRRSAGDDLPVTLTISVGDGDLKTVGWKPTGMIQIDIAITAATSSAAENLTAGREFAYHADRAGVCIRDISEVTAVRRRNDIVVISPDIRWQRPGVEVARRDVEAKQSPLGFVFTFRRDAESKHETIADQDGKRRQDIGQCIAAFRRWHLDPIRDDAICREIPTRSRLCGIDHSDVGSRLGDWRVR